MTDERNAAFEEALEPCPFCGCAMHLAKQDAPDSIYGYRTWFRPVAVTRHNGHGGFCHGEDARGSASPEAAYARWNTRALKSPAQSDAGEGEQVARLFHDTYERLAPSFGYETRADTKAFDPETPNGKLMIAVCSEVAALSTPPRDDRAEAVAGEREACAKVIEAQIKAAQDVHDLVSVQSEIPIAEPVFSCLALMGIADAIRALSAPPGTGEE